MGYYKELAIQQEHDALEKERLRLAFSVTDEEVATEILHSWENSAYQIILDAINHRLDHKFISTAYQNALEGYVEELLKELNFK